MTLSNTPPASQRANFQGHVLNLDQVSGAVTCLYCDYAADVSLIVAGTAALPDTPGPCPGTDEGRRLLAEAEREANPLRSVITEPCIATPPDWEGTDAEAVGLAVAGAVADLQRQRDEAQADLQRSLDLLAALVHATPETSWAGSNIALDKARDFLRGHTPEPGQ